MAARFSLAGRAGLRAGRAGALITGGAGVVFDDDLDGLAAVAGAVGAGAVGAGFDRVVRGDGAGGGLFSATAAAFFGADLPLAFPPALTGAGGDFLAAFLVSSRVWTSFLLSLFLLSLEDGRGAFSGVAGRADLAPAGEAADFLGAALPVAGGVFAVDFDFDFELLPTDSLISTSPDLLPVPASVRSKNRAEDKKSIKQPAKMRLSTACGARWGPFTLFPCFRVARTIAAMIRISDCSGLRLNLRP